MPITFGAVGDIISVCLLVKDLVEALDRARGSKAEYQSAIRELWILDRALLEIDLLTRTHGNGTTPELRSLCETAKQAAIRCQDLVTKFLERVRKYKSTFDEGQKTNILKDVAMKVRWHVGEEDTLEQFRVEIASTSSSLQMLLTTASVTIMTLSRKELVDKLDDSQRRDVSSDRRRDTTLNDIQKRIEEANQGIDTSNNMLTKVSGALRMDWLRQLGSELTALMRRAFAINIATYHAVINIQKVFPSRLERGLLEEPFILEDPIGRIAPVHLQFVTSWDAFNAILEIRFRSLQGHRKIVQKRYGLQERATGRDINQSRPWQGAFLPGQRVEMCFVFQDDNPVTLINTNTVICPGCGTPCINCNGADIHCKACFIWFRRITIVEDVEPTPHVPLPQPWKHKPESSKSNLSVELSGPLAAGRKRTSPSDLEGEEDVREFKRVRILSTRKRVKRHIIARKVETNTSISWSQSPVPVGPSSQNPIII